MLKDRQVQKLFSMAQKTPACNSMINIIPQRESIAQVLCKIEVQIAFSLRNGK
jgi:hypothetical protein